MDQLEASPTKSVDWLWHGYLAGGNITLLTSLWKAGKTTLVTGLLRRLAADGEFLGRQCRSARAVVISEESKDHWAARVHVEPIGSHVQLLARPFLIRPTEGDWLDLIERFIDQRAAGELDLLVVDPLATFLPGRSESDPGTLLRFLYPLQRLASLGAAVLILHHPRKESSEEGSSARGSGALLGFVDIIMELRHVGKLRGDERRRRLVGLSRHEETPRQLRYVWNPINDVFTCIGDLAAEHFEENWEQLHQLLSQRESAATHQEILMDWPAGPDKPSAATLYEWLNRATDTGKVRREGAGRRKNPYRFRLPNKDDEYYDRGELPPLEDLGFAAMRPNEILATLRGKKRRKGTKVM